MIDILYSVVDVGSNTVRLVTYEIKNGVYTPVYTDCHALGLIGEVNNGTLSQNAVDSLCDTLTTFKKSINATSVFRAFATAFMRATTNADEIKEIIRKRVGINLEILTEEQEALFSFKGILRTLDKTHGVAIDFGGGSCEFIEFSDRTPVFFTSLPFGCVQLAKKFVKGNEFPTHSELNDIKNFILDKLKVLGDLKNTNQLIITGGTARAFAQMDNFINHTKLSPSNYRFTSNSFHILYDKFSTFDNVYTDFIKSNMSNRLRTIYPGLEAINTIINFFHSKEIIISTEGVREGYLSEIVGGDSCTTHS
ncbi:MAG: hypothetical protein IJO74_01125 [Clostridia bacterium]|nr:hypothetical protein [Clostridia bacterium]